ncbi:MAG: DUF7009 family protein [Bdellovibrionia bacterium]
MNLRLSKESVRFRITRAELEHLLKTGELSEQTSFPGGKTFTYRVLTASQDALGLSLEYRDGEILLFAPHFQLHDMHSRPPAKDLGCYQDLFHEEGKPLRVALEVDLHGERKIRARV